MVRNFMTAEVQKLSFLVLILIDPRTHALLIRGSIGAREVVEFIPRFTQVSFLVVMDPRRHALRIRGSNWAREVVEFIPRITHRRS